MAKKLYKSKSNFTLRRLHQSGNYGHIYERDYTTISNTSPVPEGQIYTYSSPIFKTSVRAGFNGQKLYFYGDYVKNICNGDTGTTWTLSCMPVPDINDNKIIIKPNIHRITDFACYGSASELLRVSTRNILLNFPAEIYIGNTITLNDLNLIQSNSIPENSQLFKDYTYSINNNKPLYLVENPLYIDITQLIIPEDNTTSKLKYFCESYTKYRIIIDKEDDSNSNLNNSDVTSWIVDSEYTNSCLNNGDLLATVTINDNLIIKVYFYDNNLLYLSTTSNVRIRPNDKIINDFFNSLNDFEKVILNRETNYSAKFETYLEDDEKGWYMVEKTYKWPVSNGDWNIAINDIDYENYINSLNDLIYGYDKYYTNSIWRDMTHDAIVNMDLTISGDDSYINSTKIWQLINIIGRQFDEIKKYADNIKATNTISYKQENNSPDYFLNDNLEISGWETQNILKNFSEEDITDPMYEGRSVGFTASDANNEFLRRLNLNSKFILNKKGTKQAIEDLMGVFGYHSTNWLRKYYGGLPNNACLSKTFEIKEVSYSTGILNDNTIIDKIQKINELKEGFFDENINTDISINPYQGLPVAEAFLNNTKYLIPWFDKYLEYDGKAYFQMKGGWAKNMKTNKYEQTISNIYFFKTKEEITPDLYKKEYYYVDKDEKIYIYNGTEIVDAKKTKEQYVKIDSPNDSNDGNTITLNDLPDEKVGDDNIKYIYLSTDNNYYIWHKSEDGILTLDDIKKEIIDNNKGNNPHSGDYDDGAEYIDFYKNLFKYANFSDFTKSYLTKENINVDIYGFNNVITKYNDKCKFIENNDVVDSLYNINAKKIFIDFAETHRTFLEENVIPYIKQIIPSTTIFIYNFKDFTKAASNAETYAVACMGDICPLHGIIIDDND